MGGKVSTYRPVLRSGLRAGDTLTIPYASGDSADDFTTGTHVHMLVKEGPEGWNMVDDTDTWSVSFGASEITITWHHPTISIGDTDVVSFMFGIGDLQGIYAVGGSTPLSKGAANRLFITQLSNGGSVISYNAYYDDATDTWHRLYENQYAFADWYFHDSIPGEENILGGTAGIVKMRAVSYNDANIAHKFDDHTKISPTFAALGGWELTMAWTQYRDLVIGGFGIELDGAGLTPFGRVVHNNFIGGTLGTLLVRNVYASGAGVDRGPTPSMAMGIWGDDDAGVWYGAPTDPGGPDEPDNASPVWTRWASFKQGGFHTLGIAHGAAGSELTIDAGEVEATASFHVIDTEGDAASDDLDTITGGYAGQLLVLQPANDARTVVIKHGVGNIECGADITLDNANDTVTLFNPDGSTWVALAAYSNGA